ncbi:chromobox protein homolog 1-like [Cimex lectularius]|uniref:Chromo domain-containing protein n=1 Tax=Cimex lectularius TaxID=79782 RepID=A0A8I6RZD7_CIMLE|nr:chromobox protein homolog 1-like [Cimex lectularius]
MVKKKSTESVEKILDERTENGTVQYKVKYAGKVEPTWVDEDKLDCEEEMQQYLETKNGDVESEEDNNESEGEETPAKKPKLEPEESAEEEDPDEEFEVECLVSDRMTEEGKVQYKVRWRGYDSDQDTWENESNLDCPDIIEEYNAKKGSAKPGKKPKGKPGPKKKGADRDSEVAKKKSSLPVEEREPEKIVGLHTLKSGKRELLVRWKNLPESEDSWEPEESMLNTPVHEKFLIKEKENKARKEAKLKEMAAEE